MKSTIMIGFGNVGKALANEILKFNSINVLGVITSRGFYKSGENWKPWLADLINKYPNENHEEIDLKDVISLYNPDIAFVTIPPSYYTGEPNITIYKMLLNNNVNVITADKTGLSMEYQSLMKIAKEKELFLGYRATVMAGTPAIDIAKGLRGRNVSEIKAVLNATTNYILSLVENGYSIKDSIEEVKKIGLTEPDPRIDIDGYDAAAKIVIILNTLGIKLSIKEVKRESLAIVEENRVRNALKKGMRTKYIAYFDGNETGVHVEEVQLNSFLSNVSKNYNCIIFKVDNDTITLIGPAGPATSTARSMITDFHELMNTYL